MKVQKIFTIDVELVQKLQQEANGSALINKLLIDYYITMTGEKKNSPLELETHS